MFRCLDMIYQNIWNNKFRNFFSRVTLMPFFNTSAPNGSICCKMNNKLFRVHIFTKLLITIVSISNFAWRYMLCLQLRFDQHNKFSIIRLSLNSGCYTNNCGTHSIILRHSLLVFSSVVLTRYATAPALAHLVLTLKSSYVP
jgi:hypothetical protein